MRRAGERVVADSIKIAGEPLNPDMLYKTVVSGYMRNGKVSVIA